MEILLLAFLMFVSALPAHAGEIGQKTVEDLLQRIQTELPKGWKASYDKENSWLEISRDKPVLMYSALPNGPPEPKSELGSFAFAFRALPLMTLPDYRRLAIENEKVRKEMSGIYDDLENRHVSHMFDNFFPDTDEDKKQVARYEALRKSLHNLPAFYFRDISLRWGVNSPDYPISSPVEERVRNECTEVQNKVIRLLSKYPEKAD